MLVSLLAGEPIYEVVRPIPAHTELVAFFLPESSEDLFLMPAVNFLRNTLYRRTMDAILEGEFSSVAWRCAALRCALVPRGR